MVTYEDGLSDELLWVWREHVAGNEESSSEDAGGGRREEPVEGRAHAGLTHAILHQQTLA